MEAYDVFRLYVYPDKFLIQPTAEGQNEVLHIDRVSYEIRLTTADSILPNEQSEIIYGIWGMVRLLSGPHLLVIKSRTLVGTLSSERIWRVGQSSIYPFARSMLHLTEQQQQDEKVYLQMLREMMNMDSFYYSTTYDLTHSMQRLNDTDPDFRNISLFDRADHRFVWNRFLIQELAQRNEELSRYCLPIMLGFVSIRSSTIKGSNVDYILISRRNTYRAGTRYYMRGVDSNGHAANNVETEQIIVCDGNKFSFVQTRGSVPLYWSQRPNLKYKPDPMLEKTDEEKLEGLRRHFDNQIYIHQYGKQVVINLLDQKGHEKQLTSDYAKTVQAMNNGDVKYEAFDFHHECRKMQWHRLSILIDRITPDLTQFGYLHITADGGAKNRQQGVFRTNCIDCLDRTNVVQSMLARWTVKEKLASINLVSYDDDMSEFTDFEKMFRNIWADNADACAKQYTGTGALKTDFTRTGKRTSLGALSDLRNSLVRYLQNNFYDGFRQDSIDIFLGNFVVDSSSDSLTRPSPLAFERDWKRLTLPLIVLFSLAMCILCLLIPPEEWTEQAMYLLFWGTACVVAMSGIFHFGGDFVDRPRLAQKIKTE